MTARHLLSLAALAALSATATLPARAQTAFVSSEKDHKLTVVDLKTQAVTGTIATCKRPRHMQFSLDHRQIYVSCGDSNQKDLHAKPFPSRLSRTRSRCRTAVLRQHTRLRRGPQHRYLGGF